MNIQGLQKMTLLDYPGRVACTVFLGGCDFRCPFCHNFELVVGPLPTAMDEEEFFSFLQKRKGLLDGVAITGGEPCLRRDLPGFIGRIRELGYAVKLDTNGSHPATLEKLLQEGLVDYVAMDVKNSRGKYAQTVGLSSLDLGPIDESIALLKASDIDYEFRTTVIREFHEDADFEEIGRWIAGALRYFLQPFTNRDTVPNQNLTAPNASDLARYRDIAAHYVQHVEVRGAD